MNQSWVWAAIPITAILAGVVTTWIRARHGYPLDHRRGGKRVWHEATREIDDLKQIVASREATITKLEERVRVLERIATDKSTALRDEIERLRT
jgi:hypothetical protein